MAGPWSVLGLNRGPRGCPAVELCADVAICCLQIACREGRHLLLCLSPAAPLPEARPLPLLARPPFLSQSLWRPSRLIAHLSSTPELINPGNDFGTLCLLFSSPSSAKSPEMLGGGDQALTHGRTRCAGRQQPSPYIAVSVSSCRSRHSLASGALTASRACQGRREPASWRFTPGGGGAQLSARYLECAQECGFREHLASLPTVSQALLRGPSGR